MGFSKKICITVTSTCGGLAFTSAGDYIIIVEFSKGRHLPKKWSHWGEEELIFASLFLNAEEYLLHKYSSGPAKLAPS